MTMASELKDGSQKLEVVDSGPGVAGIKFQWLIPHFSYYEASEIDVKCLEVCFLSECHDVSNETESSYTSCLETALNTGVPDLRCGSQPPTRLGRVSVCHLPQWCGRKLY